MKISNILFLLLLMNLSCSSSDDDAEENNVSYYVGTWEITEMEMSVAQDMNNDGVFSANLLDELDCFQPQVIILKEDNSLDSFSTELRLVSLTETTVVYDCDGFTTGSGTWSEVEGGIKIGLFTYPRIGDQLILNYGSDIPGFVKIVYTKQ